MSSFQPPPGYEDMDSDAVGAPTSKRYLELEVPRVGTVLARKPMPNAVPALAMAANSKAGTAVQAEHLARFVNEHLDEGEFERLLFGMMMGEMPDDTVARTARAISTWGTPRPTGPSSASH